MSILTDEITIFTGFFAVMNPVANTPVFLALTTDDSLAVQKKIARRSLTLAFLTVSIFCLIGNHILSLFHLTIAAVHLGGGGILFFIGYDMLKGKTMDQPDHTTHSSKVSEDATLSIAVSPLAVPLLAGPGTIAMALSYASSDDTVSSLVAIAAFFILCVITYLFFISGEKITKFLGKSAINGITRFMGMIIAILGTQMLINGYLDIVGMPT